jgi:hypothetical protein
LGEEAKQTVILTLVSDVAAITRLPSARFNVYLFDENKVRVGQDVIAIQNVGPGEVVKFETTVATSGSPVSVSIEEIAAAEKAVSITVNTTPRGANLTVHGSAVGATPRMITVGPGHQIQAFAKEGISAGTIPLDISGNDLSGGSVSYELGAPSFDTIELLDGTVLNGELVSISGMDAEIRVDGAIQHIDRNKIKRVLFVHRDAPTLDVPPASAPANNLRLRDLMNGLLGMAVPRIGDFGFAKTCDYQRCALAPAHYEPRAGWSKMISDLIAGDTSRLLGDDN